jgi:hypothetical protein
MLLARSRRAATAAVIGALATIAAAYGAAPARACSYAASLSMGQPEHREGNVPTNVVPWLFGHTLDHAVVITLTDDSSAEIPIDVVRVGSSIGGEYFEARPRTTLQPYTRYTVTTEIPDALSTPVSYWFTTGAGPLDGAPPALPELAMQIADNASAFSSCGDNTFACIATPDDVAVRATITTGADVEAEILSRWSPLQYARTASPVDAPFCIELRARNMAGMLGPPSRLCSDDAPIYVIQSTSPITCEGARVLTADGYADELGTTVGGTGCATAPPRPATTALGWLPLCAALALIRRRR